jgi:hypothetical protein
MAAWGACGLSWAFLLLPSATIEPSSATASALASPWLRRGGSPPPKPASRAAPGQQGGSSPPEPVSRAAPGWPLPKSGCAAFLRHRYGALPRCPWLACPPNPAALASSAAATEIPCADFTAQACAHPLFLLRNARCRPPPGGGGQLRTGYGRTSLAITATLSPWWASCCYRLWASMLCSMKCQQERGWW